MKCSCGGSTQVKDSRLHVSGGILRRRKCVSCGETFSTLERHCETIVGVRGPGRKTPAARTRIAVAQIDNTPVPQSSKPARHRIEEMKMARELLELEG
jgi:transcriptional regulator NrdR family protein